MTAVQRGVLPVVAGLLNARRPRVDIDMEKGNGFSALFYAVDLPNVSIMQALLRRGANPNKQLNSEGNRGNTPLHLSCRLDKKDHAKMLLEYGALPAATNDYGQVPLQLVPRDSVTSNKRAFLKHFEAAAKRLSEAAADGLELPVGNNVPLNGGEL
jgi:ankyrin repeat protein